MATIRLHGKKAIIIQHFNTLPDVTLMEFEWDYHNCGEWSSKSWQERLLKNNNIDIGGDSNV